MVSGKAICSCPPQMILVDGYRCVFQISNDQCINKTDLFVCANGKQCIENQHVCNGVQDCEDNSDEESFLCSKFSDF